MRLFRFGWLLVVLVALPVFGETLTGLTSTGALVRFDSASPGTFLSGPTPVTGLGGYALVAIDRRPATGQLYGLGFNFAAVGVEMALYVIDETTGIATPVGVPFAAPRAIGSTLSAATRFGFDTNAVADRMRLVSTGRDNFRINPNDGTIAGADTIITPVGTQLAGAAYTNSVPGATSTTLYAIDVSTNPDQLVFIGGNPVPPGASPNGGVATTVGSLTVDSSAGELGFDISPSGSAYAAMAVGGVSGLYTINLASGAAALVGTFQGGTIVTGLTAGPGVADMSIVKTAVGTFTAGVNSTYNIAVQNNGPDLASAVQVVDNLPAGATFVSATPSQGSCSGTTTVTCTLGSMISGGTATITLVVTPTSPGPLSNTATVSVSPQSDPNAANNSSTAATNVLAVGGVPALDARMLALLAAVLALVAFIGLRR